MQAAAGNATAESVQWSLPKDTNAVVQIDNKKNVFYNVKLYI